jgi:DNA-binding MarR family transcriptional regulator
MTSDRTEATGAAAAAGQAHDVREAVMQLRGALRHMSAAERRLSSRVPGPGELSYPQIRALATLRNEHEMTAGELARSADLKPATVTAMLDSLEQAQIVERRRSTEDRRVCNVALTEAGQELLERKFSAWQTRWEQRLVGMTDEELVTAGRVIDAIADLYTAAAADAPSHG